MIFLASHYSNSGTVQFKNELQTNRPKLRLPVTTYPHIYCHSILQKWVFNYTTLKQLLKSIWC